MQKRRFRDAVPLRFPKGEIETTEDGKDAKKVLPWCSCSSFPRRGNQNLEPSGEKKFKKFFEKLPMQKGAFRSIGKRLSLYNHQGVAAFILQSQ